MGNRKAILYIRVSTDEQAEKGHSLAHQEDRLRNYCLNNNIEVVALFKEDFSAKTFERPEVYKLLAFLKKNKEAAELLLFLKWDRFSRNASEAYSMISTLRKLGVEPQAIEQPLDLSVPENKIMLAVYLATPEVENDRRSLNVISGMRRALKEGRWMGLAPKGYANKRDDNNKPCIVPGKDADTMRFAFEQLATGLYNIEQVRKMAVKRGLATTRNGFWYLMRNPLFIGKIAVPAYKDEPLAVVKGIHEPLISERLFYEVQDVLDGRKRKGEAKQRCLKDDLPLRGFLKCSQCNKMLTGSASKGNGGKYYYYHCTCGCKERFRANIANEAFMNLLQQISGNKQMIKTFEKGLSRLYSNNEIESSNELTKAKKELETLQKRLENAQTLMLDGDLDASDYRGIKAKLEPEINRLARLCDKLSEKNPEKGKMATYGFFFLRNLRELFIEAGLREKQQIIGSMFPEKLVFQNGKVRTTSKDNIVTLLSKSGAGFKKKNEQGSNEFDPLFNQVIRIGFEPMTLSLEG
jgi:site-specific DNA recombinase